MAKNPQRMLAPSLVRRGVEWMVQGDDGRVLASGWLVVGGYWCTLAYGGWLLDVSCELMFAS